MSSDKIRPLMGTPSGAINTQLGYYRPFDTLYVDFNSEIKGSGSSWEDPLNSLSDIFNEKISCICEKSCCAAINVYCRGESKVGLSNGTINFFGKLIVHNLHIHIGSDSKEDECSFDPGFRIVFYNFSYKCDGISSDTYSVYRVGHSIRNKFFGYSIEINNTDVNISEAYYPSKIIDITGEFHDGTVSCKLTPYLAESVTETNQYYGIDVTYFSSAYSVAIFCNQLKIYNTIFNIEYDYDGFAEVFFGGYHSYYREYISRLVYIRGCDIYSTEFNINIVSNKELRYSDYYKHTDLQLSYFLEIDSYTKFIESAINMNYGTAPIISYGSGITVRLPELSGYYENAVINIVAPSFSSIYSNDSLKEIVNGTSASFSIKECHISGLWIDSNITLTYKKTYPINGRDACELVLPDGAVTTSYADSGSSTEIGFAYIKMDNSSSNTTVTLNYPESLMGGNGGAGFEFTDSQGNVEKISGGDGGGAFFGRSQSPVRDCGYSPVPIYGGNGGFSAYEDFIGCAGKGSDVTIYYNNIRVSGRDGSGKIEYCRYECDEEYNIYNTSFVNVPEGVTVVVNYLE